jgi:hypothetical protein
MSEPAGRHENDDWRPHFFLPVLAVAVVMGLTIGLVAIGPLQSGGGGGTAVEVLTPRTTTVDAPPAAPVSISLRTKKLVWVCLLDRSGHAVIDGLNLLAGQTVGPYDADGFEVSFGNGAIDLTVNGRPVDVPAIAAPVGYRIRPDGTTRLPPPDQPSCT